MFAVRFDNGKSSLLSNVPKNAIEFFEFDLKDLPEFDSEKYELQVNFNTKSFSVKEAEAVKPPKSTEERLTSLEDQLAEADEIAIDLYEASLANESINAEQDEAIIDIYEIMEGLING